MSEATTLPNVPQPQAIFLIDKISKIDVQLKKAHSFRKSPISEESIQNIRKFEKNVGDQNSLLGDSICSTKEKKVCHKKHFRNQTDESLFPAQSEIFVGFTLSQISAFRQQFNDTCRLVDYNYMYFFHSLTSMDLLG